MVCLPTCFLFSSFAFLKGRRGEERRGEDCSFPYCNSRGFRHGDEVVRSVEDVKEGYS